VCSVQCAWCRVNVRVCTEGRDRFFIDSLCHAHTCKLTQCDIVYVTYTYGQFIVPGFQLSSAFPKVSRALDARICSTRLFRYRSRVWTWYSCARWQIWAFVEKCKYWVSKVLNHQLSWSPHGRSPTTRPPPPLRNLSWQKPRGVSVFSRDLRVSPPCVVSGIGLVQ